MYLMYADESGNTGTDYDDKNQPVFVLAGVIVKDTDWHKINDTFEKEKLKIYPEFKDYEIHASELFNTPKRSVFNKYTWQENLEALEKIMDIIVTLNITFSFTCINKMRFKKHLNNQFGTNIKVDPYLYAFALMYDSFNGSLKDNNLGIIFTDEINNISSNLELLYPKLAINHRNIIEKSLYLDSKKNNFIQIADICALYVNKYMCIKNNLCSYNEIKEEHCLKMYDKLLKLAKITEPHEPDSTQTTMLDNLFK